MREPSPIHDARENSIRDEWDEELKNYHVQCVIQTIVAVLLLAALIGLVVNTTR